jgi:hypothetical protein
MGGTQVAGPPSAVAAHVLPVAQSVEAVQPVLQTAFTQAYGEQLAVEAGVQWPALSQVAAPLAIVPLQAAGAQDVPTGYLAQ